MNSKINIAMCAGEASGDLLGAHLIQALKKHLPNANFYGIGGTKMLAQGFNSYFKMEDIAVMGYFEVLKNIPKIVAIRQSLIKKIIDSMPDIFIGIDAPDFNFKIEEKTHNAGIATIHYVSPSVWAWKAKRVDKIINFTDNILCLFPMEPSIYQQKGGKATFVGHPLASEIPTTLEASSSKKQLKMAEDSLLITLMPGSRISEISKLAPLFLETAKQLHQRYPKLEFYLPSTHENNTNALKKIISELKLTHLPIHLTSATKHKKLYLNASNLALVASGTATLEVALCQCPMLISYCLSPLTYFAVKPFIKTSTYGLPNILLKEKIAPELIQTDATVENLVQSALPYLEDQELRQKTINKFKELHQMLRLNTSELAAASVLELMSKN